MRIFAFHQDDLALGDLAKIQFHRRLAPKNGNRNAQFSLVVIHLFDNAIEASMALPEDKRLIRVYVDMKGNQLYISFTNFTASGKQKKREGRFRTTKGEGHGFGLVRMDAIVERLGGWLSRNSEDGAFTTEILLPTADSQSSPSTP